jgi:Cft2 family RNA processing exonuclease
MLDPESDIKFINVLNKYHDQSACSILKIKEITIMLDCGIREEQTQEGLDICRKWAEESNIILMSHATYQHVGALPYLSKHGVLADKTIRATSPVCKMGQLTMYEYLIQQKEAA